MLALVLEEYTAILSSYFYSELVGVICQYAFWTCSSCRRTRWPRCRLWQKCTDLYCVEKRRAPKATMHGSWRQVWGSESYLTLLTTIKTLQDSSVTIKDIDSTYHGDTKRLCRILASELQLHWPALERPYRHMMVLSSFLMSKAQGKNLVEKRITEKRRRFSATIDAILRNHSLLEKPSSDIIVLAMPKGFQ